MSQPKILLHDSWKSRLSSEFETSSMQALKTFLKAEKAQGKVIYPRGSEIFHALDATPFPDVKVVILGQDPYHGPNQAHGLCFSVQQGVPPPPSLKNMYKELAADVGFAPPPHGCLESWTKQGVLLLNSVLTVEQHHPASHQGRGWETFTDRIIALLNEEHLHLVFMLWGAYAKKKGALIDRNKHLVLEAAHPSPFSVQGFLGCRHFSKANVYLEENGKTPINWQVV